MKTTRLFQLGLVSALSVSALTMSSSAFEDRMECGMPLDVWESTQNPVPEGIAYEYIVDENGYYTLIDEEGPPLPLDEEMMVSHVFWGSPGIEGSTVPALYDTIIVAENQYILGADSSFDGILTEEIQSLGVISLEEVYNTGDFAMYLATTSEDTGNILEELVNLNLFLTVERNAVAEMLYSEAPAIDCDLSHLFDENGNYIFDENDQIPEGIPYEYVTDEEGNFVLIGEEASSTTSRLQVAPPTENQRQKDFCFT